MTSLRALADEYLGVRHAVGFKLEEAGRLLPTFVAFVERHASSYITAELAFRWAMESPKPSPKAWAKRLAMARHFAKYAHAQDPRTEIPSQELLPRPPQQKLPPYFYSADDVQALLRATKILPGLIAATYATLLGLLAATGMRVGEAIRLDRSDIDWRNHLLVVRYGKFGKARELPLHRTTIAALRAYAFKRDRALLRPKSPSFFLSLTGARLIYKNVHFKFLRIVRAAGLADRHPHRPRIHDLRHTFAIKALLHWYQAGVDVQARLASLSTYLGHVSPSHTYWYLTATPELLRLASQRFERTLGDLS